MLRAVAYPAKDLDACEVSAASTWPQVSIVISNYNYAEFLGTAIDSALNLDWPALEVIVVDDGSTDGSRAVIESYGERVTSAFQPNGGQTAACNTGFALARGEIIIFLDADDVLSPSLIREIARVWRPGISKVQFQMHVIDSSGSRNGSVLPQYRTAPTPAQIRTWAIEAVAYPTPPGSGNAYSRTFLEKIFPLSGSERASDTYCLAAAPYLGDVVTIPRPLASYRVHGRNDGAMAKLEVKRFAQEVSRAQWRFRYSQRIARSAGIAIPDSRFNKSLAVLPYRLASICLSPEHHPIPKDSPSKILADIFRASFVPQGVTVQAQLAISIWSAAVALAPASTRAQLVIWRFAATSRPQLLKKALKMLGVVNAG
jgi:glycosyltransferase involved in cell wall biosynthesis